jgi:hypothetical protein
LFFYCTLFSYTSVYFIFFEDKIISSLKIRRPKKKRENGRTRAEIEEIASEKVSIRGCYKK